MRRLALIPAAGLAALAAFGCGQKEKPLGRTDFPSSFAPGAPKPGQNTPPPTAPPAGMMTGPGMVPGGQAAPGGVPAGAGVPMGAPGSGTPMGAPGGVPGSGGK